MKRCANRADIVALNRVLVEKFIVSQSAAPEERVLDVDALDIALHGDQECAEFPVY